MNPNYVAMVKQALDKLFVAGFIALVEEATWLSLIVVVSKNNSKPRICVDFRKLNVATKKDPYPCLSPKRSSTWLQVMKCILSWMASHATIRL
jgi:hypothetical protein